MHKILEHVKSIVTEEAERPLWYKPRLWQAIQEEFKGRGIANEEMPG